MSPWWLRPTAEGADEPDDQDNDNQTARTETSDDTSRSRGGGRKPRDDDRSGRRSRSRRKSDDGDGNGRARSRRDRDSDRKPERDKPDRKKSERKKGDSGGKGRDDGRSKKDDGGSSQRSRDRDSGGGRKGGGDGKDDGGGGGRWERQDFKFDDDISLAEIAEIRQEILSPPERNRPVNDERKIALFCDLENIALGVRDSNIKKFDITIVMERLLEKGKIIVKKAYCDWERYSEYKRPFHEAAIEMIDIPQKYYSGKNSADIKMVVDAMDLSFSKEHLDTFVVMSGDSDFSPLVSKLKENNKYVIGIGVKDSSSNLLIENCDEFIYYEDLWRDRGRAPTVESPDKKKNEAFKLMVDAIQALLRDNKDVLWGSMIKQTMQRKRPSFNEGYYGYSTFSDLLEDAERNNLIKLKKDQRSGTYIVTGFSQR